MKHYSLSSLSVRFFETRHVISLLTKKDSQFARFQHCYRYLQCYRWHAYPISLQRNFPGKECSKTAVVWMLARRLHMKLICPTHFSKRSQTQLHFMMYTNRPYVIQIDQPSFFHGLNS